MAVYPPASNDFPFLVAPVRQSAPRPRVRYTSAFCDWHFSSPFACASAAATSELSTQRRAIANQMREECCTGRCGLSPWMFIHKAGDLYANCSKTVFVSRVQRSGNGRLLSRHCKRRALQLPATAVSRPLEASRWPHDKWLKSYAGVRAMGLPTCCCRSISFLAG